MTKSQRILYGRNCLQTKIRCLIKFVPRTDRNDPEHSLFCYILIYDIRIFSTKINMMKLLANKKDQGVQSSWFVPRIDRNDPEHSSLCY